MNFKDSYKKANEKIYGDMSILDGIYEPKKKIITPYFYRMTTVAAAFILIGAVVLMPSLQKDISPEREILIKEQSEVEKTGEATQGEFKFMAREMVAENTSSGENANETVELVKPKAAEESFDESIMTEDAALPEIIEDETKSLSVAAETETASAAYTSEEVYDTYNTSAQTASGGAGGGGGAAANNKQAMFFTSTASLEEEENLMNTEEVLMLLGISMEKLIFEDMELNIPETIKVTFYEEGEIEDFAINFSLTGNESKIEGILINSVNPVPFEIKKDGGVISAGKTFGNTDIFIKAYNMEIEKVEAFLERFN